MRPSGEVTNARKDECPDTILMDSELCPGSLALQNHMENLMVFEDFEFFDYIILTHIFSCMDGKNRPVLSPLYDHLGSAPGQPRVAKLVAWEEPDWKAPLPTSSRSHGCTKR